MNMRFKYSYSHLYGWTVYDTERGNIPAYDACSTLLPLHYSEDGSATAESPVMMDKEFTAMRLCSKLNHAWRLYCKEHPEEV